MWPLWLGDMEIWTSGKITLTEISKNNNFTMDFKSALEIPDSKV